MSAEKSDGSSEVELNAEDFRPGATDSVEDSAHNAASVTGFVGPDANGLTPVSKNQLKKKRKRDEWEAGRGYRKLKGNKSPRTGNRGSERRGKRLRTPDGDTAAIGAAPLASTCLSASYDPR